jgi:anti-anti-sigma regulatory factor
MAAPQGTLSMHQDGQTVFFRVEGWGRMPQGLALRRCGDQFLANGIMSLRVDLRRCTYLDSTFLGTLLYLQRNVYRKGEGEFTLLSPSAECRKLFHQMDLDDFFTMTTEDEPLPEEWTELCCQMESPELFKPKVVEAHQELANVPGKCGETFREVVRGLVEKPEAKKTP